MEGRQVGTAPLALAALALATLALAARADAFVYWTNTNEPAPRIGRANLDGTGVNQGFIQIPGGVDSFSVLENHVYGLTVDGGYLYWAQESQFTSATSSTSYAIIRTNLDGSRPQLDAHSCAGDFIAGLVNPPHGIAVDGAHVYWTNGTSIGRANLDGTGANESFITGATAAGTATDGVAVDGAHIYWTDGGSGTIGRANLDGTGANPSLITGATGPAGVTVDGAHVYWANSGSGTIGRANLDGTGANPSFITGATGPAGVTVDGAHVYWANSGSGTIGRANLDGTGANPSFITGAYNPLAVAVDALSAPPPIAPAEFSLDGVKLDKKRGSAKLSVTASLPGKLRLEKTGSVKASDAKPSPKGKAELAIKAKGTAEKTLNETGKVKVKAEVSYIPDCAPRDTESKKIKLVKR